MTIKQTQHLLAFLQFYGGKCDGIWGPLSVAAMTEFQQRFGGLSVTGQVDSESAKALRHAVTYWFDEVEVTPEESSASASWWNEIQYFTREEFRCQCGGKYCNGFPAEPDERLVRTLDAIRRKLGVPITIVEPNGSGVRCPQHNAAVGGVANSEHLYGRAADLHSSASPERMKQVAEEVMGQTGGIGIYEWGIHVDVGKYSRWDSR